MQVKRANAVAAGPLGACELCDIRQLAVCGALEPHELPHVAAIAHHRQIEPGATVLHEGDPAEDVFTVIAGTIKIFKLMPDGRRQITGFVTRGDFIGLAFGDTYVYSAEAIDEVTICRFRRAAFQSALEAMPHMEKRLLSMAGTELAAAQQQMLLLGRKTARERLASFIAGLAARHGITDGNVIPLPMGRHDIADFLGLTIETVSRTFTVLRKEGLIRLPDKHSVIIEDRQALEALTGDLN